MRKYYSIALTLAVLFSVTVFARPAQAGFFSDLFSGVSSLAALITAPKTPSIEFISPKGGDVFVQGQPIVVKWNSQNLPAKSNIKITLRQTDGDYGPNYEWRTYPVIATWNINSQTSPNSTFTIPAGYTTALNNDANQQSRYGKLYIKAELDQACTKEQNYCAANSAYFTVIPQITDQITWGRISRDVIILKGFLIGRNLIKEKDISFGDFSRDMRGLWWAPYKYDNVVVKEALIKYQKSVGITGEDGYVGPKTKAVLNEELALGDQFKSFLPYIKIISPNNNEVYKPGDKVEIKYQTNISDVQTRGIKLELYKYKSTLGRSYVYHPYYWDDFKLSSDIGLSKTAPNIVVDNLNRKVKEYTYVWTVPKTFENEPEADYAINAIGASGPIVGITREAVSNRTEKLITIHPTNFVASAIDLLAPNGGETINAGELLNIKWKSTGFINVKQPFTYVELKDSAGKNVSYEQVWGSNCNEKNCVIRIPSTILPGKYKVTVTALVDRAYVQNVNDTSENYFTIKEPTNKAPSVTVTSPNGGEQFKTGNNLNIRWSTKDIDPNAKVSIAIKTYYSEALNKIAEVPASQGSYSWTIPNSIGEVVYPGYSLGVSSLQGWVKVTIIGADTFDARSSDLSDNTFTVNSVGPVTQPEVPPANPTLTLASPNGGESYKTGETIPVRWVSNMKNIDTATIYITGSSGSIISTLTTAPFKNGLAYVKLPNTPGNFKIMVSSGTPVQDISDNTFTIKDPTITTPVVTPTLTLTSPNGGEKYAVGDKVSITWNAQNAAPNARLKLSLRIFSLNTPKDIATVGVSEGRYDWIIPSDFTRVGLYTKITASIVDTSVTDESNNWFNITPTPVVIPSVIPPQAIPDSPLKETTIRLPNGAGVTFYESFGGPIPQVVSSGRVGDIITIHGKNFTTTSDNSIFVSTNPGANAWQFEAKATDGGTKLAFNASSLQTGQYYIYVLNENGQSNFIGMYVIKK